MYAILKEGPEREVSALSDADIASADTTRQQLREVWEHRCTATFLIVAMAVVEGRDVRLPRRGHDPFTDEIAALVAIRNAVVHNEGHIRENRHNTDALTKVTSFHTRMEQSELLWGGFGSEDGSLSATCAPYWTMDDDRAVFTSGACDRILALMQGALDCPQALSRAP